MSSTLNFETAVESIERKKAGKSVVVALDGREMEVTFPSETRILLAERAARKGDLSRFIDLMLSLFSEEDQAHIMDRIEDDDDPFDIIDVEAAESGDPLAGEGVTLHKIFMSVVSEMSARPTGRQRGSSGSQKSSGKSSTGGARPKAKRRATSPSTGS